MGTHVRYGWLLAAVALQLSVMGCDWSFDFSSEGCVRTDDRRACIRVPRLGWCWSGCRFAEVYSVGSEFHVRIQEGREGSTLDSSDPGVMLVEQTGEDRFLLRMVGAGVVDLVVRNRAGAEYDRFSGLEAAAPARIQLIGGHVHPAPDPIVLRVGESTFVYYEVVDAGGRDLELLPPRWLPPAPEPGTGWVRVVGAVRFVYSQDATWTPILELEGAHPGYSLVGAFVHGVGDFRLVVVEEPTDS
jgi:hypothetical protein